MKPSHIPAILDLAREARRKGEIWNPLFTSEAGLGKSSIIKSWVKKQRETEPEFGFLDLRIAYVENVDLLGTLMQYKDATGDDRSKYALPEFWPKSGNGLLLLEEPNRGSTMVMNCLMQILTDRQVHKYLLPEGWVIAAAINPDSAEYDVNSMDAALKDRFEIFEVEHDHIGFLDYVEDSGWHENVVRFLKSGIWVYKTPKELAKEAKYLSPRTWSKMNAAENSGVNKHRQFHRLVACSVLGKDIGTEYHRFCFDQAPVTAADLLKDRKAALERLKQQSDKDNYKGDMLAATVESIQKAYGGPKDQCPADKVDEETMAEVAKIIPGDLAMPLIKDCIYRHSKGKLEQGLRDFVKKYPEAIAILRSNVKINSGKKDVGSTTTK